MTTRFTSMFAVGGVLLSALMSAPTQAQVVTLPDDIVWETNLDDPPIGSEEAIRGGTINLALGSYPLTFRLMGPNSNDSFAGWNRAFTWDFTLVRRHPVTGRYMPKMATHWSVQDDQRTIYFRLDPDARWSDGEPITADDYVFTLEMMRSPAHRRPLLQPVRGVVHRVDRQDRRLHVARGWKT